MYYLCHNPLSDWRVSNSLFLVLFTTSVHPVSLPLLCHPNLQEGRRPGVVVCYNSSFINWTLCYSKRLWRLWTGTALSASEWHFRSLSAITGNLCLIKPLVVLLGEVSPSRAFLPLSHSLRGPSEPIANSHSFPWENSQGSCLFQKMPALVLKNVLSLWKGRLEGRRGESGGARSSPFGTVIRHHAWVSFFSLPTAADKRQRRA